MKRQVFACLALAAALWAPALPAQGVTVFLGGVHARYADSVTGTAGVVSARLGTSTSRSAIAADASFSRFRTGETAIQFGGQGVYAWPVSRSFSLGFVGLGTFGAFDGGSHSGIVAAGPALLLGAGRVGGSLRIGAGAVRRVDGVDLSLFTAETRFDTRLTQALSLTLRTSATHAQHYNFMDFGGEVGLARGSARLESGIGWRVGDLKDNPEWHVRLSIQATGGTVLEAATGAYPRDLSGFNSGGFASVGVRASLPSRATRPRGQSVAVQRLNTGRVRLTIAYPEADAVAIAGEWNAWTPAALSRDGSRWTIELGLRPGVYRFSLLVNGDRWTVPENVTAVPDDFGGKAALLVIP
jgi:hypothetical protein